jgi:transcription elongation GreA/GreB family factor
MREESKRPLIEDDEELDLGPDIASVGDTVTLLGIYGEEMYTLVKTPGDPIRGYLNINTPVGAAILGKKRGQTVIAQTPNGLYTAIIDEINKAKVKKMSGSN